VCKETAGGSFVGAAYNRKSAMQIYNNYADIILGTCCARMDKVILENEGDPLL
jgi:hypothetical protein